MAGLPLDERHWHLFLFLFSFSNDRLTHIPPTLPLSVEGPGAAACEPVQPTCSSGDRSSAAGSDDTLSTLPFPIPASVSLLAHEHEEAETGVGEEMKEHVVVLGDLISAASPTATAGEREWEAALREAAKAAVPGLDEGLEALQVTVWSAAPDPFFSPDAAAAAAGEGAGADGGAVPFKVREWNVCACGCKPLTKGPTNLTPTTTIHTRVQFAFVTTSPDDARALVAALQGAEPLLQQHLGSGMGAATVSFARTLYVPAYDPEVRQLVVVGEI